MPETLLTGMTANVTFIEKQVRDVLYVSNKAVTMEGSDAYVTRKLADGTGSDISLTITVIAADVNNIDTVISNI